MPDVESSEPEIWREIKELEQREADAMLRADVSAQSALWSDDLLVNSTANLIAENSSRCDCKRTASVEIL
jgi:hypothetical protein